MTTLIEEALSQSLTQWVALISGIIYVVLAARENVWCWAFGIISCTCIAWDDFYNFRLYADGVLQLTYIVLGVYGLYKWNSKKEASNENVVHEYDIRFHLVAIAIALLLSVPTSYLLRTYTEAAFGYTDTLTTLLSLYATWLLIKKVVSNWLFWIAIDVVYVYLFFKTGGLLIAVLYIIFMLVAIYGYYEWRKKHAKQMKTNVVYAHE